MRTAAANSPSGARAGAGKRILHDDGLDLDELTSWIAGRHDGGTPVAVHCVTAAQLVVTIAALRAAGALAGDRIEHAAVAPDDCLTDLAELGLTVVTQPNFVAERGDQYLVDVPAVELPQLWRLRSLLESRVRVALSTDSPFGGGDPWAAMRAAVRRETPAGAVLGPSERVSAATALNLFFGAAEEPPGHAGWRRAARRSLRARRIARRAARCAGRRPGRRDGRRRRGGVHPSAHCEPFEAR